MTKRKTEFDGTPKVDSASMVFVSDYQCRYNNKELEQSVNKFIKDFRPETVIIGGDLTDFQAIGKYPSTLQERMTFVDDINESRAVLERLRKVAPNAEMFLLAGNHEERLQKFLTDKAPELQDLESLKLDVLLGLKELDIEYIFPYGRGVSWHSVLCIHGNRVNAHSAFSAKAEFYDSGTSLVMGHVQRAGAFYVTDREGTHAAFEAGCMCHIEPDLAPPSMRKARVNNWQNAFVYGESIDKTWTIQVVCAVENRFVLNGKLYRPDEKTTTRGRGRPKKEGGN